MKKQVVVPPSKSISHRSLICAALARGLSRIRNPLISEDILCTIRCLQGLGAQIAQKEGEIIVSGVPSMGEDVPSYPVDMDVGESGTTCRLITPVAATFKGIEARIHGRGRMHQRPIEDLARSLEGQGVSFRWEERRGYPPYILSSQGLMGGEVEISLEKSSQFLSGLLLASPLARQRTIIKVIGEKVVSWPYVGLTLEVMEAFGVDVKLYLREGSEWKSGEWRTIEEVHPGKIYFEIIPTSYKPCDFWVEGDWSNASYFVAAGLFLDEGLFLKGVKRDSLQGDKKIVDILRAMGGEIEWHGDCLHVLPSLLYGIEVDMGDCPDLVPTVAVVASMARGKTTIRGVAHLVLKESNRLMGIATQIQKMGAEVAVFEDGLTIYPGNQSVVKGKELFFKTYSDHRMAMSLSLYELVGARVHLDDRNCVSKSFPEFFQVWKGIKGIGE